MILSNLGKTYIFDLDGTLLLHNGHINNKESLLPHVSTFFENYIRTNDFVIITTARSEKFKNETIKFLEENNIRFDHIIFDLPHGERILFNDRKNSGLQTAYAINLNRNEGLSRIKIETSSEL